MEWRHKVEDRDKFTDDQKAAIARKSDNRCAWCGKKVFFGYGGTVDHFIPIKKGGTNEFDNLVLMCKDCNEKKRSMIIPVQIAGYYLKEPYQKKLKNYFDDYIKKYDYVSRGNLMCCDLYGVYFFPEAIAEANDRLKMKGKKLNIEFKQSRYIIYRAYPDDEDKLVKYFIKYLKKNKNLDSPEAARQNIRFWMRFGTIYFIMRDGEILAFCTMLMNKHRYLSVNIFCYYNTQLSYSMSKGIITCVGDAILEENDIPYLPISVNMLLADKLTNRILNLNHAFIVDNRMACVPYYLYNYNYPKDDSPEAKEKFKKGVEKLNAFMKRFYDIEDDMAMYFYKNDLMDFDWMAEEVSDRDFFQYYSEPDRVYHE